MAVLAGLLGCPADDGSSDGTSDGADDGGSGSDTGGAPDGAQLFVSLCSSCHGADALGTVLGFELRHPDRGLATWVVRNGRTSTELAPSVMAAYSPEVLSDDELEAIFDHLDSFEQPTTGEGLYVDYCRNCHGADAQGGEVGVSVFEEIGEVHEKVREGENEGGYGARTEYMSARTPDELSNAEIDLIVDYVLSL